MCVCVIMPDIFSKVTPNLFLGLGSRNPGCVRVLSCLLLELSRVGSRVRNSSIFGTEGYLSKTRLFLKYVKLCENKLRSNLYLQQ